MSTDLVPAANMAAIEAMEPATREVAVTHMLSEARQWLAHAVETTGPSEIAGFKAFLATVEETTRQLSLSKEIQLDATEMVRRAERGIGVAIRRGQDEGQIAKPGDIGATPGPGIHGSEPSTTRNAHLDRAAHYFSNHGEGSAIYAMTDGVSDEQFEDAVTEAKAEGNPSRANVIRKIRGEAATVNRPEVLRKTRRLDSNRIVEQTVLAVSGIDSLFGQIDFSELDRALIPEWISSLSEVNRALRSLRNNLEKELNR